LLLKRYERFSQNFYIRSNYHPVKAGANIAADLAIIKNCNNLDRSDINAVLNGSKNIKDFLAEALIRKNQLLQERDNNKYEFTYSDANKSDLQSLYIFTNFRTIISLFNFSLLQPLVFDRPLANDVLSVLAGDQDPIYSLRNNVYNPNVSYKAFVNDISSDQTLSSTSTLTYVNNFIEKSGVYRGFKNSFTTMYTPFLLGITNQPADLTPANAERINTPPANFRMDNYLVLNLLLFKRISDILIKHSTYNVQNLTRNYIVSFNNVMNIVILYTLIICILSFAMFFFGKNISYAFSKIYRELNLYEAYLKGYTEKLNMASNINAINKIVDEPPFELSYTPNKELGKLVSTFNENSSRIRKTLSDQILLKVTIRNVFAHLIFKNQGLINKQVKIIDQMERSERDENKLQNLFAIDHITAILKRNIDNLSILSGNTIAADTKAVHLFDVARFSLSEVEEYNRIEIDQANGDLEINPKIVKSLSRILSELLDNALYFSSKKERIFVKFTREKGTIIISVLDRGIGIAQESLQSLNDKLRNVHEIDINVIDNTGFYVISRLASEHSITVSLTNREDGHGVIAKVSVPESHILKEERALQDIEPPLPETPLVHKKYTQTLKRTESRQSETLTKEEDVEISKLQNLRRVDDEQVYEEQLEEKSKSESEVDPVFKPAASIHNADYNSDLFQEDDDNTVIFNHLKDIFLEGESKNSRKEKRDGSGYQTVKTEEESKAEVDEKKAKTLKSEKEVKEEEAKKGDESEQISNDNRDTPEDEKLWNLPTRKPNTSIVGELLTEEKDAQEESEESTFKINPESIQSNLSAIQRGIKRARDEGDNADR
jgi:signal transduction histidine kinase